MKFKKIVTLFLLMSVILGSLSFSASALPWNIGDYANPIILGSIGGMPTTQDLTVDTSATAPSNLDNVIKLNEFAQKYNYYLKVKAMGEKKLAQDQATLQKALVTNDKAILNWLKAEFNSQKSGADYYATLCSNYAEEAYTMWEEGWGDKFYDLSGDFSKISASAQVAIDQIDATLPDLKVGAIKNPTLDDISLSFDLEIKNAGKISLTTPFEVKVESLNEKGAVTDTSHYTVTSEIKPNMVITIPFSVEVDENTVYSIPIKVTVDAQNAVLEANENNNVYQTTVTPGNLPLEDKDKDGIEDSKDNCPAFNPNQRDSDKDGKGDACEEEVITPIVDTDKDGIEESKDNCPKTANPDQLDKDTNGIGDACEEVITPIVDTDKDGVEDSKDDTINNLPTVLPEETKYNELKSDYQGYSDDFDNYKEKYEKAVDENNDNNIKKYKLKLEDLDEYLKDLEKDAKVLEDDIKANVADKDKKDSLVGDVANLQQDIEDLRNSIDDALNYQKSSEVSTSNSVVTTSSTTPPANPSTSVEYFPLDVSALNTAQPTSSWEQIRVLAWLGGGVIALLAVVIFLFALLIKEDNLRRKKSFS